MNSFRRPSAWGIQCVDVYGIICHTQRRTFACYPIYFLICLGKTACLLRRQSEFSSKEKLARHNDAEVGRESTVALPISPRLPRHPAEPVAGDDGQRLSA